MFRIPLFYGGISTKDYYFTPSNNKSPNPMW